MIQVREIPDSERTSTQNGIPRGELRFIAYDDGVAPIQKPFFQTGPLHHPNMPRRGDLHPRNVNLRASDYSIRPIGDKTSYVYEYTWTYDRSDIDFGDQDPGEDPDILEFVEFTVSWTAFFVDAWRTKGELTLIPPPQGVIDHSLFLNNIAADNVGGDPIDSNGEPGSVPIYQQELNIQHVVEGTNIFGPIRNAINKRNDADWRGAVLGSLLYKGANTTRIGANLFEVNHVIVWDEFYHARQLCWRDPTDGKFQTGRALDPDAATINSAYLDRGFPVRWIQPYNALVDFDTLQIPSG